VAIGTAGKTCASRFGKADLFVRTVRKVMVSASACPIFQHIFIIIAHHFKPEQ
jgi:hypothetical protein